MYGSEKAPLYDLSKIKVKMGFFMGDLDELSDPTDDAWLMVQDGIKQNLVSHHNYKFGHISFIMANQSAWFNDVLSTLKLF